jgi:hypothetical protein
VENGVWRACNLNLQTTMHTLLYHDHGHGTEALTRLLKNKVQFNLEGYPGSITTMHTKAIKFRRRLALTKPAFLHLAGDEALQQFVAVGT